MTNEEREIITRFIGRFGGAAQPSGFGATSGPPAPLPPIDKEADDLIGQLFTQYPEARYRVTQMAFVQEAALAEAQNRMRQMQGEIEQMRQQGAQGQHRGFFGNLFGGGGAPQGGGPAPGPQAQQQYAPPPPPPPQYAPPQYRPGMFQRSGSGFLGSALTTAAGVAGGLVAGNALMDLFSGGRGGFGGGFGGVPGGETVVNNYYGDQAGGADPWGAGGAPPPDPAGGAGGADPWAAGGAAPDPGQADPGWGNAGTSGTSGTGGAGGTTGGGGGSTTGGGGGG